MGELTLALMQRLWPHGNQHVPGLMEGIVAAAPLTFARYSFRTSTTIAQFMAQVSEECGAGLEMVEDMDYTAERLRVVFPTHFSLSMAARYAHHPRSIADIAYGGRMGNAPPPSDDGWNFRGRGLTNMTGRDGDAAAQKVLDAHGAGFNILTNPELICSPEHALEVGIADFIACGCLPAAENDNIVGVTEKLNGGLNGLADREAWLPKWKTELAA